MPREPREAIRAVLIGAHLLLSGIVLVGMVADPKEFMAFGSISFLLLMSTVWGLVIRSRLVIVPAVVLIIAETMLIAVIIVGNIAWPEAVVARFFLGWAVLCGLQAGVIILAASQFRPKGASPGTSRRPPDRSDD